MDAARFSGLSMSSSYVPLWCKSNYSFLEGASDPEELVETAAKEGMSAIAITDRDGLYGIVRAHVAAKEHGIKLIVGAQISVGKHLFLLYARNKKGYSNLSRLISLGRLRNPKGSCNVLLEEICAHAEGLIAVWAHGMERLSEPDWKQWISRLRAGFGEMLYTGIRRHYTAAEVPRNSITKERAEEAGVSVVATPEILYHRRSRRPLQDVLTAIRHNTTVQEAGTLLQENDEHEIKSAQEMNHLYADCPECLQRTLDIALLCAFSLDQLQYRYPSERVPASFTTASWLRHLTIEGARKRYPDGTPEAVSDQLAKELAIIEELDYCGYFLTMYEIVAYCSAHGILCQGRGSAANSAVCFCLGITAIDPVRMDLLFERFISRERAEPPDIDLDIEHRRREEVIQHMYRTYGRERAAMVANVVRYRSRSAIRDVGKALGISETALDRLARLLSHRDRDMATALAEAGLNKENGPYQMLLALAEEILDVPRHLSIHPGGFLLGSEPVIELVPVENATMPGRTVIQWDKYDVEEMHLFKVDLLGLGALTHLDYSFRLLRRHYGRHLTMAGIPSGDPAVYRMITRADTVGVFQLESRAQMAMLPRLKPVTYYDLVVEVSIVRPGPITGGMVHPYLRRRNKEEKVTYPHSSLEPVLAKTLGVPLFQEQVMKLAMIAADYTPGEADQLRRDMAAWRKTGRIEAHHSKLIERMVAKGIDRSFAEQVFDQIRGFGEYGFPESHAASFALIAYCTAWMRHHYPTVFTCALLNAWPMGFYAPATIIEDAKRMGLRILPVDVLQSRWHSVIDTQNLDQKGRPAIRMGLRFIKGFGRGDYTLLVAARNSKPASLKQFMRTCSLAEDTLQMLAGSGAFSCFGVDRREALWQTAGSGRNRKRLEAETKEMALPLASGEDDVSFDVLTDYETIVWDYRNASHSALGHPLEPHREELKRNRIPDAAELSLLPDGSQARYAGLVICRQRPETASGTVFMTLEDESGFVNLVIWKKIFERFRRELITATFLGVEGRVQAQDGVTHLIVTSCFRPRLSFTPVAPTSRDFR